MLRKLATGIVEHPRLVLAATVLLLVLAGALGGGVTDRLKVGGFDDPGSESAAAGRFLDERFGASPNLVLQVTAKKGTVDAPDIAAAAVDLSRRLLQEPDLKLVGSYWDGGTSELRSTDRRSGLILLHIGGSEEAAAQHTERIVAELPAADPSVEIRAGGPLGLAGEIDTRVHDDLIVSESIALPATLILLVVAFGGIVAALVPLAMGVASIMTTLLTLLGLSLVTDVSVHALTVATAFGLGLAIDFGLLMVSRFREERDRGHPPQQAVVEAVATAGRTILFSAATVTFAMAGLLAFPLYFLRSVGLAAIAVVVVAAVGAVVVLPALLAVIGSRIDSLVVIRRRTAVSANSRFWRRTAAAVMRRPVLTALPVVALLLVLAVPFLTLGSRRRTSGRYPTPQPPARSRPHCGPTIRLTCRAPSPWLQNRATRRWSPLAPRSPGYPTSPSWTAPSGGSATGSGSPSTERRAPGSARATRATCWSSRRWRGSPRRRSNSSDRSGRCPRSPGTAWPSAAPRRY
jgi:Predicted drug exporters of the RND superfamily